MAKELTHINKEGYARMVDVSEKPETARTASAEACVLVNEETFGLIVNGGIKKGDVLSIAQVAGIMAAKHTSDLIPLCHNISLSSADLEFETDAFRHRIRIISHIRTSGQTGVEMEALMAVTAAALTIYDMCKAVQRDIEITGIRLLSKNGGVHGDYQAEEKPVR